MEKCPKCGSENINIEENEAVIDCQDNSFLGHYQRNEMIKVEVCGECNYSED